MAKIIGNIVTTPMVTSDWAQTNPTKADYIKNKPEILTKDEIVELVKAEGGDTNTAPLEIGSGEKSIQHKDTNTRAVAENSVALGYNTLAGSKAFTITEIDATNKTFKLDSVAGLENGDIYSCFLINDTKSKQYENYGVIEKIDETNNLVTVDLFPADFAEIVTSTSYIEDGYDTEANSFRIIAKPNVGTRTIGANTFTAGVNNKTLSKNSAALGENNLARGSHSFVAGRNNEVSFAAVAFGRGNKASYDQATAFGGNNTASGYSSLATGQETTASGVASSSFGNLTKATGKKSSAFGGETIASGENAVTFGYKSKASGENSIATGKETIASGTRSMANGFQTVSTGGNAVSLGNKTSAKGNHSVATGDQTIAEGESSLAEGRQTIATRRSQHVQGEFNIADPEGTANYTRGKYAHIVGNGTADDKRSNAHTLDWSGNAWFAGDVYVGEHKERLATESYVDNCLNGVASVSRAIDIFAIAKMEPMDCDELLGDENIIEKLRANSVGFNPKDVGYFDGAMPHLCFNSTVDGVCREAICVERRILSHGDDFATFVMRFDLSTENDIELFQDCNLDGGEWCPSDCFYAHLENKSEEAKAYTDNAIKGVSPRTIDLFQLAEIEAVLTPETYLDDNYIAGLFSGNFHGVHPDEVGFYDDIMPCLQFSTMYSGAYREAPCIERRTIFLEDTCADFEMRFDFSEENYLMLCTPCMLEGERWVHRSEFSVWLESKSKTANSYTDTAIIEAMRNIPSGGQGGGGEAFIIDLMSLIDNKNGSSGFYPSGDELFEDAWLISYISQLVSDVGFSANELGFNSVSLPCILLRGISGHHRLIKIVERYIKDNNYVLRADLSDKNYLYIKQPMKYDETEWVASGAATIEIEPKKDFIIRFNEVYVYSSPDDDVDDVDRQIVDEFNNNMPSFPPSYLGLDPINLTIKKLPIFEFNYTLWTHDGDGGQLSFSKMIQAVFAEKTVYYDGGGIPMPSVQFIARFSKNNDVIITQTFYPEEDENGNLNGDYYGYGNATIELVSKT